MDAAMKFKAGNAYVCDLSAKLLKPRNEISAGSLKKIFEFGITLDDSNKHQLIANATVTVEGTDKKTEETAFSVSAQMECKYYFDEEIKEDKPTEPDFVRMVSEPLYHRAALLVEQTTSSMGLSSVKVGTSFPIGDLVINAVISDSDSIAPKKTKRKAPVKKT